MDYENANVYIGNATPPDKHGFVSFLFKKCQNSLIRYLSASGVFVFFILRPFKAWGLKCLSGMQFYWSNGMNSLAIETQEPRAHAISIKPVALQACGRD